MYKSFTVKTKERTEVIEITQTVQSIVDEQGVSSGICCVFIPHTTAGIMINERCDGDVAQDITTKLDELVPRSSEFRHCEGNSDAHIKASLIGTSRNVIIAEGRLLLGTWQGLFFFEFDGPRTRTVWIQILREETEG